MTEAEIDKLVADLGGIDGYQAQASRVAAHLDEIEVPFVQEAGRVTNIVVMRLSKVDLMAIRAELLPLYVEAQLRIARLRAQST